MEWGLSEGQGMVQGRDVCYKPSVSWARHRQGEQARLHDRARRW